METWILCMNLRGARLFRTSTTEPDEKVSFVAELMRPLAQTRDADFAEDQDLPEVLSDGKRVHEEEVAAEIYARALSLRLVAAHEKHRFDSLIICAEPKLLGIVVSSLAPALRNRVSGLMELDLYEVNESDLSSYLRDARSRPHQFGAA